MLMTMWVMYTDSSKSRQKNNFEQKYTMVELILEGI